MIPKDDPFGTGPNLYAGLPGASRVLIVDDEKATRNLLRQVLREGFCVATAPTAEVALTLLRSAPCDVLVADKNLPNKSGLELAREVLGILPDTSIILLTGHANIQSAIDALRLGAFDYLVKPFDVVALLETVRLAAERKHLHAQRRLAEQELRHSEERLKILFEYAPDAYYLTDPYGTFLDGNRATERLIGYKREQLIGKSILESGLLVPEDKERAIEGLVKSQQGLPTEAREFTLVRGDGSQVVIETSTFPVTIRQQPCVLGMARDVTQRRRTEDDRERHRSDLEALVTERTRQLLHADRLAAVGQLANGVAHEINNPASFILANLTFQRGLAKRLREALEALQARAAKHLSGAKQLAALLHEHQLELTVSQLEETLRENTLGMDRVRSVTRDLRTFAMLEQDQAELVDVNEIIRSACRLADTELRHRCQLVQTLNPVPLLPAHRGKLAQVITNLLVNAAQSIQEGAADKNRIEVVTRLDADRLVIMVEDTGCGIAPEQQERIFEPFYTTKRPGEGTGLGLSLCADIVRQHRGEIGLESKPGQGSRFQILLPVNNGLTAKVMPDAQVAHQPTGSHARVLVIDDEAPVLRSIDRMLDSIHHVKSVQGGEAALALLDQDRRFDVILCDLMMPNFDGPMFYEGLRTQDPELLDRVVFMSGGAFTPRALDFITAISNPCLDNPLDFQKLLGVIEALCQSSGPTSPLDVVARAIASTGERN